MSDNDYATRPELSSVKSELLSDIKDNRVKIQENAEHITELQVLYKSLADLPSTMNSLDKTIVKVCNRLDNMDENLKAMNKAISDMIERNKKQDDEIRKVDAKSKVDWATFITDNFWKVIFAVGVIYYVVKDMVH